MIRSHKSLALALLFSAAFAPSIQAKSLKGQMVFVDVDKMLGDLQEDFKKFQESEGKKIQEKMASRSKDREKIEAKKKDVKDTKKIDKDLEDHDKESQGTVQMFQMKMQAEQQKLQSQAEKRMDKVKGLLKEEGWASVAPTGSVIAFDPEHDVTDVVVKKLGLGKSSAKAAKK